MLTFTACSSHHQPSSNSSHLHPSALTPHFLPTPQSFYSAPVSVNFSVLGSSHRAPPLWLPHFLRMEFSKLTRVVAHTRIPLTMCPNNFPRRVGHSHPHTLGSLPPSWLVGQSCLALYCEKHPCTSEKAMSDHHLHFTQKSPVPGK